MGMKIGIIGGGQLGRMFIQNGLNYGIQFHVLDPDPQAPCSKIAHRFVCADRNDADAVFELGKCCDVVTIEIENVSIDGLKRLEKEGVPVYPQPRVLELVRDKGLQKEFYQNNGLPTADFALVGSASEIANHHDMIPVMQKLRVGGYDGRGVKPLKKADDINGAFDEPSVLEKWVDFKTELAVLVARNRDGQVKSYPVVEMVFNPEANLVEHLISPARIDIETEVRARELAEQLITKLDMVGLLAVEMFMKEDGQVLINEIAPRPHNSGHHTIEACFTSQYDQHLRAIMNWPLGHTVLRCAAAMANLLGEKGHSGPVKYHGLEKALALPGVYPHIYGKTHTKPFRKMGHVTILGNTSVEALATARQLSGMIKVVSNGGEQDHQ
ncbi:MAG: 5-(carboxyamino)imidazole ribonucleotide synthase [Salibacteraceae bacterium]